MKKPVGIAALSLLSVVCLAACNGETENGAILGTDLVSGSPQPLPDDGNATPIQPPAGDAPEIGATCRSDDPRRICLSLKYAVYQSSSGKPIVSESQTLANLEQINRVWSKCGIAFEVGDFAPVNPQDLGVNFNTATASELGRVRRALVEDDSLLVVTTGSWSGSLGAGSANAWTTMPGGGPYGVVMEEAVGTYPNIVAHELGHYLNLDHAGAASNVMSAVIYSTSSGLSDAQCTAARSAATRFWAKMQR